MRFQAISLVICFVWTPNSLYKFWSFCSLYIEILEMHQNDQEKHQKLKFYMDQRIQTKFKLQHFYVSIAIFYEAKLASLKGEGYRQVYYR